MSKDENEFDFERLKVYQRALEFADKIFSLSKSFSHSVQYSLGDHMRKTTISICNNIAEGSGKQSKNAKIQFYGYAIDSARECIPMISISARQNHLDSSDFNYLRQECKEICNMLGGLIRSMK
jgi:four helix bundle protein